MKTIPTLQAIALITTFCALASLAHAAGPEVATVNIFTSGTASSNTGLTQYGAGDPVAINDGVADPFYFQDGTNDGDAPEYLSLTGLDTSSGIDSIVFFGNNSIGRTTPGVTIYTSTSDLTGSAALDPSDVAYTDLGHYDLPTVDSGYNAYSGGNESVSPYDLSYDILSGLGIAAGTQSVLFSFDASPNDVGNGFFEIEAFPTSNVSTPVTPEPSTWAMLLVGLGLLVGASRIRSRRS